MAEDLIGHQGSDPLLLSVHESPEKALAKVGSEFEYWSGKLTDSSLQMCYALIGANWAVFGSIQGITNNGWAKTSLVIVLLTLASNVGTSWWASEKMRNQFEFAEGNPKEWKVQFEAAKGTRTAWPFTPAMERVGIASRHIKGLFPLVAGLLLIVGALLKH